MAFRLAVMYLRDRFDSADVYSLEPDDNCFGYTLALQRRDGQSDLRQKATVFVYLAGGIP